MTASADRMTGDENAKRVEDLHWDPPEIDTAPSSETLAQQNKYYSELVPIYLELIPHEPLFVNVFINGKNYMVVRGKRTKVPRAVEHIIKEQGKVKRDNYKRKLASQAAFLDEAERLGVTV